MTPSTGNECWRAASRRGPTLRTVTRSARRSPRRVGVRKVCTATRSPPRTVTACRSPAAPAEGCQASRTIPRKRRGVGLVSHSVVEPLTPSRTWWTRSRLMTSLPGLGASSRSSPMAHAVTSHQIPTVVMVGWSTTAIIPSIKSAGARPVNVMMTTLLPLRGASASGTLSGYVRAWLDSAGNRHGGQGAGQHRPDADALELGFRTQGQPVGQRCVRERLDVIGGDELPAAQPGPDPAGRHQCRGATWARAQGQRRRLPGGPGDVDDVSGDLGRDSHRPYGLSLIHISEPTR